MSKANMSRSEIREIAFQSLFPLNFNAALTKEDALEAVYELDHAEWLTDDKLQFTPVYLDTLIDGVLLKQAELDEVIKKHLSKNWNLNRCSRFLFGWILNFYVLNDVLLVFKRSSSFKKIRRFASKFINGL